MDNSDLEFLKDFFTKCDQIRFQSNSLADLEQKLDGLGYTAEVLAQSIHPPLSADLHLHSNYSDGQLFPRQVAWMARLIGLQAAALVDHNSVSGVKEFIAAGQQIGLEAWGGIELETALPGCEILVYFPETGPFLKFLDSPAADFFHRTLERRQETLHSIAIQAMNDLNKLLRQLGKTDFITEEELAKWYSGVTPYYPGTLSVLFLERLSAAERERYKVFNPRNVTTKFLTPILQRLKKQTTINKSEETLSMIKALKHQDFLVLAVLAHPVEMRNNAGMTLAEIKDFSMNLACDSILDGIEVRNPRDGETEAKEWLGIWQSIREELLPRGREFLAFSYSSDFHILTPDENTGTFTLGYGLLNQTFPNGNLKELKEWQFFRKMIFKLIHHTL